MKLIVTIESRERTVEIEDQNGHYVISIDGEKRVVDCQSAGSSDYLSLIIDGKSWLVESAAVKAEEGRYFASIGGRNYDVEVLDERLRTTRQAVEAAADSGLHTLTAPMPGLIVDVRVDIGDTVEAGQTIVVMEAMKMQNELASEVSGVVKAIHVGVKDSVDSLAQLIEIEQGE